MDFLTDKNSNDSGSSSLDEFQFKPLTDGLGFHKKTLDLKEETFAQMPTQTGILPKSKTAVQVQTQMSTAQSSTKIQANVPTALKSTSLNPQVKNPAPTTSRNSKIPEAKYPQWKPALAHADILSDNANAEGRKHIELELVSSNWPAALFDTAMIAGMTLLFSAIVFALTKVEVSTLIDSLQSDLGVQLATFTIVFAVFEIYTVVCRAFFAKTLGEWVFDARLGLPTQQTSFSYPFKVAFRTLLITLTGFIVLPILSSAVGKDIAGILSGVKLYLEKNVAP